MNIDKEKLINNLTQKHIEAEYQFQLALNGFADKSEHNEAFGAFYGYRRALLDIGIEFDELAVCSSFTVKITRD